MTEQTELPQPIPDPKRSWKIWRVYGENTPTYWIVVDINTDAGWYGESCPPNTAFECLGTLHKLTRFRAEKVLAVFATDYGKGK